MQAYILFLDQHLWLTVAMCGVIFLLLLVEARRAKKNTFNINPLQLTTLINKQNAAIIDIRDHEAWRNGHIIGAQSLSATDLGNNPARLEKLRQRPVVIVASSPTESHKLTVELLRKGYNAYSLSGGIKAWHDAQMPLIKEQK